MKTAIKFMVVALCGFLLTQPAPALAADDIDIRIDATQADFLTANGFGPIQKGYTAVVPPFGINEGMRYQQTPDGYVWDMYGVEFTVWQAIKLPEDSRYLLNWHFEYTGRRLSPYSGRQGIVFGNTLSEAFMSIEVDRFGTPRLMLWGRQGTDMRGTIVWRGPKSYGGRDVSIVCDYDIKNGTLSLAINGNQPQIIDMERRGINAPLTIKSVGFMGAVNEAQIVMSNPRTDSDYDIDLRTQYATVEHKGLVIQAEMPNRTQISE